jgi:hypothetical protein
MKIGAGKFAGSLETSSHNASMPLNEAPITNRRSFIGTFSGDQIA